MNAGEARVGRDETLDVVRGVAVVLMIQTHAYDGWVRAADRQRVAYGVTRVLGAIPAPLFCFLAGIGLALGAASALRRAGDMAHGVEASSSVRSMLARRGLRVWLAGYGVSLAYAALEGSFEVPTLLRADILHAIGLSLSVCAMLFVGRSGPVRATMLGACLAVSLGLPVLWSHVPARAVSPLPQVARAVLGLWLDVPEFTRFPVFPMLTFTALGVAAAPSLPRLGRPGPAARVALVAAMSSALAWWGTGVLAELLHVQVSRGNPTLWTNAIDGAARALATLATVYACAARLPRGVGAPLVTLGRHSLVAYAFHVPICYGRLAAPFSRGLSFEWASIGVALLVLATYGFVVVVERVRRRSDTGGAPR